MIKFSEKSLVGKFLLMFVKREPVHADDRETLCLTDDGRDFDDGIDIHQDATELYIKTDDVAMHTVFVCPRCGGRNRIARGPHANMCVKCDLNVI